MFALKVNGMHIPIFVLLEFYHGTVLTYVNSKIKQFPNFSSILQLPILTRPIATSW